jgi:2-keto-4-pentenoate hydratase/2-oxohepta-3-ene-1,7-dioic acid hydratase in catechol pathway
MPYRHLNLSGAAIDLPLGKVVCVGRNYADHARELNNPVPTEPVLFIKPSTALCPIGEPIRRPEGKGSCHYETEICLLIGKKLTAAREEEALGAIYGVGLGLDLTLRELQSELKAKSLPWEKAKAFDGSCPVSAFAPAERFPDWSNLSFQLLLNGQSQQEGRSEDMLTQIPTLLAYISEHFTLLPGDLVMTGTPAGVGPLSFGDRLELRLADQIHVKTEVI